MSIERALRRHSPGYLVRLALRRTAGTLTGGQRQLPDVIIAGAQRCGTTSLFNYLTQHPDFHPSYPKEVNYFTLYYGRGPTWYRSHFPLRRMREQARRAGRAFVAGEATPYYIFHPHAPRRMAELVPDARLILLLRNPVDRAYSHYHYEVKMGIETLSFDEAITREEERLAGEMARFRADESYRSFPYQHFSYLARSRYAEQLEVWLQHFSPEQTLILKSEDLYADSAAVLEQVLAFAGLPAHTFEGLRRYNETHHAAMDAGVHERLDAYFQPHNQKLYELIHSRLW